VLDEIALRLMVAAALGSVVGVEREASGQPAGLRTHVSVALGACLFGVVSTLGFLEFGAVRETTNIQVDVTRVASNVVVGIGFIGAGLIFRQGGHVRNLTTAASLWTTAAIGLAAGVGNPGAATLTTAALVLTLIALRPLRAQIERRLVRPRTHLTVVLDAGGDPASVTGFLESLPGVVVRELRVNKLEGRPVVRAGLVGRPGTDLGVPVRHIAERTDVYSVVEGEPG
jgi:putative Mg2+ transporter-C (MgtC) family protein